jgi:hypothetical protein
MRTSLEPLTPPRTPHRRYACSSFFLLAPVGCRQFGPFYSNNVAMSVLSALAIFSSVAIEGVLVPASICAM